MTDKIKNLSTLDESEKGDVLSDLETLTNSLVDEWDGAESLPLLPQEFYVDARDFANRWFETIMNR